jgi:hypothetical protein
MAAYGCYYISSFLDLFCSLFFFWLDISLVYFGVPLILMNFTCLSKEKSVHATILLAHMGNRFESSILLEIIDVFVTLHFLLSESIGF